MAAFRSAMMFVLFLSVTLHVSLLFGVISVGSESHSTAVTVREEERVHDDEEEDGMIETIEYDETDIFQPTSDWQTIKEGQAIPAGLHVRINLSTGEKEAKLLDEKEKSREAAENGKKKDNVPGSEQTEPHTMEDLEERLAKIEGDDECGDSECRGKADNEALIEEVKKRYRSIEELKEEFAEMDMKMETDYEIMTKLIREYREKPSIEHQKLILQDLEFYVHQVDNAVDLKSIGGWDLIMEALNSSEEAIQSEAAHVLGAAVQSNAKAQVIAYDMGAMHTLLRLLSQSPSPAVQKRALFALSSLLRFFPYAQQKFLELGGLSVLSDIMRDVDPTKLPVKIKSITLLHDLQVEQDNVMSKQDIDEHVAEKRAQYEKITLVSKMVGQGWCEFVPSLLDASDHDTREKVLHSLQMMTAHCTFNANPALLIRLNSLKADYDTLAKEEVSSGDGGDYFTALFHLVSQLIHEMT